MKVKIDLSDVCDTCSCSATDILSSILNSIGCKTILLVEESPDTGVEVLENTTNYSYSELMKRLDNAEDVEDEIEKIAREEAGGDEVLITVFDGYDWAYAVIVK